MTLFFLPTPPFPSCEGRQPLCSLFECVQVDAMSDNVPFLFCSDFREDLAAARFEPSTFRSTI